MYASHGLVESKTVEGGGGPARRLCPGTVCGSCRPSNRSDRAGERNFGLDGLLDDLLSGPGGQRQGKGDGWYPFGRTDGDRRHDAYQLSLSMGCPRSLVIVRRGSGGAAGQDARRQGDQAGAEEATVTVRCNSGKDAVHGPGRRVAPI